MHSMLTLKIATPDLFFVKSYGPYESWFLFSSLKNYFHTFLWYLKMFKLKTINIFEKIKKLFCVNISIKVHHSHKINHIYRQHPMHYWNDRNFGSKWKWTVCSQLKWAVKTDKRWGISKIWFKTWSRRSLRQKWTVILFYFSLWLSILRVTEAKWWR